MGDKNSKFGEDIFAHRFMMMIASKEIPNATIVPVHPVYKKDILDSYKIDDHSLKLPFLMHILKDRVTRYIEDDPPRIEAYLEDAFAPRLQCKNPKAYKMSFDVFQKFMFYVKTTRGSPQESAKLKNLNDELAKIDDFLSQTHGKYLDGDTMTIPDCHLLPKLHYIRVAGKYFRQFEIPDELTALKKYLEAADLDEAFQCSKCTDKEVLAECEQHAKQ